LTGHSPCRCQWAEQSKYHRMLQHDEPQRNTSQGVSRGNNI
jgi:hypothetical protein